MLSVAVCDDEILECCNLAAVIRKLMVQQAAGYLTPWAVAKAKRA